MAADAKLGFDDNAAYRQKELFAMRDHSQEDPRRAPLPLLRADDIGQSLPQQQVPRSPHPQIFRLPGKLVQLHAR